MCGIAGRCAPYPMEAGQADELAATLADAMRQRGPDGWGQHHDGELLLVHRRLAIIDLSPAAAQPLWNEDHTVCVVVNGEIYNHAELRRRLTGRGHRFRSQCDSEVLVHLYEEGGITECCSAVEGMFAFALWDARPRDVYLVRDRLGIKPLVLAEHAGGVTFASTLPALLRDSQVPRDLRDEAFVALLKWGFVPSPWSAVKAARHLEPGTWVRIRNGRVADEKRWWLDEPVERESSERSVREAIEEAVRSHLVADVPVSVLLSSGIDSGIVTALASRERTEPKLEAWTVRHEGFVDDEYPGALLAAEHFGVRCTPVDVGDHGLTEDFFHGVIQSMDEPLGVSSLVGLNALFAAVAPSRRVVLTGDGGDELFGGYGWHAGMPAVPAWASTRAFTAAAPGLTWMAGLGGRVGAVGSVAVRIRRHSASVYLDKLRICDDASLRALGLEAIRDDPMEHRAVEAWERYEGAGTLEQMLAVDRATALVDEMLAKVDCASMAHGVEARVPLLADGIVAAAKGLPRARKRRDDLGKVFLRDWYAEMGPKDLAVRRKTGFNSPVRTWLQADGGAFLRSAVAQGLSDFGAKSPGDAMSVRTRFSLAVAALWRRR